MLALAHIIRMGDYIGICAESPARIKKVYIPWSKLFGLRTLILKNY